jgi:hypothetical protein
MTNRPHAGLTAERKNALARAIEPLVAELLQTFDIDAGAMVALLSELEELEQKFKRARASYDGANPRANTADDPMVQAARHAACRRHGIEPADFRDFLGELSFLDDLNPRRVTR